MFKNRFIFCFIFAFLCLFIMSTAVADENELSISGIATYQDEMYAVDIFGSIYRAKTPNNWEKVINAQYPEQPVMITWGGDTLYYIVESSPFDENMEITKIDYLLRRATMADDGSLVVDKEAVALDVPDVITDINDDYVFRKMIFVKDKLFVLVQSDRNYIRSNGPFDIWSVNPETGDVRIVVQRQEMVNIFPAMDRIMTNTLDWFYIFYGMNGEKQELFYKSFGKVHESVASFYDQDTNTLYYSEGTILWEKQEMKNLERLLITCRQLPTMPWDMMR